MTAPYDGVGRSLLASGWKRMSSVGPNGDGTVYELWKHPDQGSLQRSWGGREDEVDGDGSDSQGQ